MFLYICFGIDIDYGKLIQVNLINFVMDQQITDII